jgi:hypothetical protein
VPQLDNYLAFNIAFVLVMLGWELFLVIKLFYGASLISKLAFKPFKWACAALTIYGVTMVPLRLYSRDLFYQVENCPQKYTNSWIGLTFGNAYYIGLSFC